MSKQSEQRSYSVDEMMERLKDGDREKRRSEESELVTRPDGSQVVRVRRRKRRTSQPAKTKEIRQRRYGLIAIVAVITLVIVVGAGALILLARFNSSGYRDSLKERMLEATGAKVGISDLVVTPTKARAKSVQLAWPAGGIARSLKLEDLQARLDPASFLGSQWKGGEVLASSGMLILGPPDGSIVTSVRDAEFPLDYNSYRCSKFELVFGRTVDEPALQIRGAEMTLRPKDEGGVQFLLSGGTAELGLGDELKIDRGLAELRDGRFQLDSLRLEAEPKGLATVKSTRAIVATNVAVLELKLEKFPLAHLLGSSTGFGRMLSGTIEAPGGTITADPRFLNSGTAKIQFTGKDAALDNFRFLQRLSSVLNKIYYGAPDQGTIEGIFQKSKEGVRIDKFKFEAKPHIVVEGNMAANPKGELSGDLRVGVPEVLMMRDQKTRRYTAFSEPYAGYCWIDLKLSGTLEQPEDDFFKLIKAASDAIAPTDPRLKPEGVPEVNPGVTPLTPEPTPAPETERVPRNGGGASPAPVPAPRTPGNPQTGSTPRTPKEALEDTFDRLTK